MLDLGTVRPGSTIRIPFSSFDKDDGSSITMTNYAAADILVYKDGGTTERASTAGFTATTDFDTKTGKHLAIIDLADNTTAGFYAAGSEYLVAIDAVTVDAVTTGGWIARFRIGYPGAILDTTIATLASQTSFTLTAGPAEDDALNGMWCVIHDVASAVQMGKALISDYTGSTKTVTLAAGTTFTAAATDNFSVIDLAPVQPTVTGRTLDVSSTGEAGIDWANIGSPTTAVNLSATNIDVDQVVASVTGAVGSVTGAVGSVTGNVGGNVTGSVGSVTGLTNATIAEAVWDEDATAHQTQGTFGQAIGDPGADTDTIFGLLNTNLDATVSSRLATASYTAPPSAASVADAVWDEDATAHQTQGTFGQAIGDPGADTDTIFGLVNTNLNATVSSRASQTSVDTIDDFLDTEIASILADTNELQTDWANGGRLDLLIDGIKGKTDSLTFTVANQVDANPLSLNSDSTAAANIAKTTRAIGRGTVTTGASTTSIPTSAFTPNGAAADQFKGRVITFDADTTTTALRGQSTDITASTNAANPTFTVTALTTAPSSGDTFSVT